MLYVQTILKSLWDKIFIRGILAKLPFYKSTFAASHSLFVSVVSQYLPTWVVCMKTFGGKQARWGGNYCCFLKLLKWVQEKLSKLHHWPGCFMGEVGCGLGYLWFVWPSVSLGYYDTHQAAKFNLHSYVSVLFCVKYMFFFQYQELAFECFHFHCTALFSP